MYWKDTGRAAEKIEPEDEVLNEPQKCDPHAHRHRGSAVAGLVVLLLQ
jgi:hypothetical protein